MSTRELVKSKAAKLFVTRNFSGALKAFQQLEKKYPEDIAIKRYIGASLFHLKQNDEAAREFNNILTKHPTDLPSRDFLAKIYLRQGDLDLATTHFSYIAKHDTSNKYSAFAKAQLASIQKIKSLEKAPKERMGRQIPIKQFLQSLGAKHFASAQYKEALVEFTLLEKKFPKDVTIKRYKALSYSRLGNHDQALRILKQGLKVVPDNIATHYFMAQEYMHQKKYILAKANLDYVVRNDKGQNYKRRASRDLISVNRKVNPGLKKKKKFKGSLSIGGMWNSNVSLKSDKDFTAHSPSALKIATLFLLNRDVYSTGPWTIQPSLSIAHGFHTHSVEELNYLINTAALNLNFIKPVFGKSLFLQISPNYTYVIVQDKFYNVAVTLSELAVYSISDWWRLILLNRTTHATYNNDGSTKQVTSKEGWSNTLSVKNNFYLNDENTFYVQQGVDYEIHPLEGSNQRKVVYAYRSGVYFPIHNGFQGIVDFQFKQSDFPDYGASPATKAQRKDAVFTYTGTIAKKLSPKWKIKFLYSQVDSNSKDNLYTYVNHITGGNITYSFK
jgi:tetratricopeptide (TPR) repeat protein